MDKPLVGAAITPSPINELSSLFEVRLRGAVSSPLAVSFEGKPRFASGTRRKLDARQPKGTITAQCC
jgi:hypothetical protein